MKRPPRVLAAIADSSLLGKLDPIFRRRALDVHHVPTGASALVVAGNVRFDVIVLESPLPDLELGELFGTLRAIDSSSGETGLLVLAEPETAAGLAQLQVDETVALPSTSEPLEIHRALSKLLGVAARRTSRLQVQVEVSLDGGSFLRVLSSQNISSSGILLRGGRQLELGDQLRVQFALPGDSTIIVGQAVVVRRTGIHEATVGTALRFLEIADEHRKRIADFVHAGLADPPEPRAAAGAGG